MKKTNKLVSLLLVLAMVLTMLPMAVLAEDTTTETVLYLKPNSNWTQANARFAAYLFGSSYVWLDATLVEGTEDIYAVTVPSEYVGWTIIFCRMNPNNTTNSWNNKWNQTGDLTWPTEGNLYTINSGVWDSGSNGYWSSYTPPSTECEHSYEGQVIAPTCTTVGYTVYTCTLCGTTTTGDETAIVDHTYGDDNVCDDCGFEATYVTTYFVNVAGWDAVYAYAWNNDSNNAWPGVAMTAAGTNVNGYDIYEVTFNVAYENVIFHNNAGTQSADQTLLADLYFDAVTGGWYNTADEVPNPVVDSLATNYTLNGSFNNWAGTAFTRWVAGNSYAYVQLELDAYTHYEFKIVADGSWLSCADGVTGTVNDLYFTSDVVGNCTLDTGVAGTYFFTVNMDTNTLSVNYPVCEHSFEEGVCTFCGEEDPDYVPPACTHENTTTETYDATCTAGGSWSETCNDCGEVVNSGSSPATGHDYVDGICTLCGKEKIEGITIYFQNNWMWSDVRIFYWGIDNGPNWPGNLMEPYGNDGTYDVYVTVIPYDVSGIIITGVKNDDSGLVDQTPDITEGWYDGICYYMTWNDGNAVGTADIDDILPPEPECAHSYSETGRIEPTCYDSGCIFFACGLCGDTYEYNLDPFGHRPADCNKGDGTHYSMCCVCLETLGDPVEHTFVDGVCTCGETLTMKIYFQNNWMWTDVCMYYWFSDNHATYVWPGVYMDYYTNDGTYDIYVWEVPVTVAGMVINGIKNDGSGETDQTPDITEGWYDGICYYMTWNDGNQVGSESIDVILSEELPNPEKIEGLTAVSATTDSITVEWAEANNVVKYWVFVDGEIYNSTTDTAITINKLAQSTTYTVAVTALLEDGTVLALGDADTVSAKTNGYSFNFSYSNDTDSITLNWAAEGSIKTWIYFGTDPSNLSLYASSTDSTYTIKGLDSNSGYYVTLSFLIDGKVVSLPYTTQVVTAVDEDLKVTLTTDETVSISWNAVEDSTKYWIYVDGTILCSTTVTNYTFEGWSVEELANAEITVKGYNSNGVYDYYPAA